MTIENNTIINKMIEELEQAKVQEDNELRLRHIASVRLLCDLILDETTVTNESKNKRELMETFQKNTQTNQEKSATTIDHGEANGESIFDF